MAKFFGNDSNLFGIKSTYFGIFWKRFLLFGIDSYLFGNDCIFFWNFQWMIPKFLEKNLCKNDMTWCKMMWNDMNEHELICSDFILHVSKFLGFQNDWNWKRWLTLSWGRLTKFILWPRDKMISWSKMHESILPGTCAWL